MKILPSISSNLINSYGGDSNTTSNRRSTEISLLHLPSTPLLEPPIVTEPFLEESIKASLDTLQAVQKNLEYWKTVAEGTKMQKSLFMICKQGPISFINGAFQLVQNYFNGSGLEDLHSSYSTDILEKITALNSLRCSLATYLGGVYYNGRLGQQPVQDENKIQQLNVSLSQLEDSISFFSQRGSLDETITFVKILHTQLTETESIDLIYENLNRLHSYVSMMVSRHRKPRKMALHWIKISCIVICSCWLIKQHKSGKVDMTKWVSDAKNGSIDIFNWFRDAAFYAIRFWKDHVQDQVRVLPGVKEPEQLQLMAKSAYMRLFALSEKILGEKLPENASLELLCNIFMRRQEEYILSPVKGLPIEPAKLVFAQACKLNVDLQVLWLKTDNYIRTFLARFPPAFVICSLVTLVKGCVKAVHGFNIRRLARIQKNLALVEVYRAIDVLHPYKNMDGDVDDDVDEDMPWTPEAQLPHGMLLHYIDSLQGIVEVDARLSEEWRQLREDFFQLARFEVKRKATYDIMSRMKSYHCLPRSDE